MKNKSLKIAKEFKKKQRNNTPSSRNRKVVAVGEMFLLISFSFAIAFLMSGAANHFTNPLFRKDVS